MLYFVLEMLESTGNQIDLRLRISSVLNAPCLDKSVTGFTTFDLQELEVIKSPDFAMPSTLRLGHLVERTVAEVFRASENYSILFENLQVVTDGKTIGELDLIVQEKSSGQLTHVEIAYKFYLLDPSISNDPIKNWIGPNRNDTLYEKLGKLKTKQFPLLHHPEVAKSMGKENVKRCEQALCFMAHLFVPRNSNVNIPADLSHAIRGDYLTFEDFFQLDHSGKQYHIPKKTDWGIDPSLNEQWLSYENVEERLVDGLNDRRALLCWQKDGNDYSAFFLVWW
ncbi:MAG: hypothetical protein Salg2KO_09540 [Salibacteraceae bacterium]